METSLEIKNKLVSALVEIAQAFGSRETLTIKQYNGLANLLDKATKEQLELLVAAEIKFLSALARNRLNRLAK